MALIAIEVDTRINTNLAVAAAEATRPPTTGAAVTTINNNITEAGEDIKNSQAITTEEAAAAVPPLNGLKKIITRATILHMPVEGAAEPVPTEPMTLQMQGFMICQAEAPAAATSLPVAGAGAGAEGVEVPSTAQPTGLEPARAVLAAAAMPLGLSPATPT